MSDEHTGKRLSWLQRWAAAAPAPIAVMFFFSGHTASSRFRLAHAECVLR